MKKLVMVICICCMGIPILTSAGELKNMDLFFYGGVGVSGVMSDDTGEPFKEVDGSFNLGFSLRINEAPGKSTFLRIDFGYLEVNWITEVVAAPYLVWRGRSYLNLNGVIGYKKDNFWIGGGLYLAVGIEGWWVSEIAGPVGTPGETDIGLLLDVGHDLGERFYVGAQIRYGLLSQYSYASIKTFVAYATLGFKLTSF